MSARLALLFFTIITPMFSIAQSTSVKIGIGYGFPVLPEEIQTTTVQTRTTVPDPNDPGTSLTSVSTANKVISGSYATGLMFTGSLQHMINDNLGWEVDLQYLLGKSYESKIEEIENVNGSVTDRVSRTTTFRGRGILLTPSAVFYASGENPRPYATFGVTVGKVWLIHEEVGTDGSFVAEAERKVKGNVGFGFSSGLGVDFRLGNMTLFSEVNFLSMRYYPKESEVTRYEINGVDLADALTVREKRTVYNKEYTVRETVNDSVPTQEPRKTFPFTNLSLNAGVKITFGSRN